jgi:two-component system nitrate/nitrite response regulator NarL
MQLLVLSKSPSFEQYLNKILSVDNQILFLSSLDNINNNNAEVVLLHVNSIGEETEQMLLQLKSLMVSSIAIAADNPSLAEMLMLSNQSTRAYFNTYMAEIHYRQMLKFVAVGQHWYSPGLLQSALNVANDVVTPQANAVKALEMLTRREKDITSKVAKGLNNKEIATVSGITERTVKAHLTKIFKKSGVSDRVSLSILANASQLFKST